MYKILILILVFRLFFIRYKTDCLLATYVSKDNAVKFISGVARTMNIFSLVIKSEENVAFVRGVAFSQYFLPCAAGFLQTNKSSQFQIRSLVSK